MGIIGEETVLPGINGFLGTRGSLMMDIVVLAMLVVIPAMAFSISQARHKKNYTLHKYVQLTLAIVLLIAVALFEIDIQFISKWEHRAEASRYFQADNLIGSPIGISLIVHLLFAVPTLLLWIFVIVQALRKFESPPRPSAHSKSHVFWSRIAAIGMFMTAVTGWIFYWLAFAC